MSCLGMYLDGLARLQARWRGKVVRRWFLEQQEMLGWAKWRNQPGIFWVSQNMGLPGYPNLSHFMVFVRESALVMTRVVTP